MVFFLAISRQLIGSQVTLADVNSEKGSCMIDSVNNRLILVISRWWLLFFGVTSSRYLVIRSESRDPRSMVLDHWPDCIKASCSNAHFWASAFRWKDCETEPYLRFLTWTCQRLLRLRKVAMFHSSVWLRCDWGVTDLSRSISQSTKSHR